jgi:6,7-dimethyl-8-ribityllumazine synthase
MSGKLKTVPAKEELAFANAANYLVGIVVSEYHSEICEKLKKAALNTLKKAGVHPKNIVVKYAPGAYEIPLAARWLFDSGDFDAIVCLGCVIKGDTEHDFYINDAIAKKLMEMSVQDDAPYVFGVLTVNNLQQAIDRSGGKLGNKGEECALAALKMLALRDNISE